MLPRICRRDYASPAASGRPISMATMIGSRWILPSTFHKLAWWIWFASCARSGARHGLTGIRFACSSCHRSQRRRNDGRSELRRPQLLVGDEFAEVELQYPIGPVEIFIIMGDDEDGFPKCFELREDARVEDLL